jgi:cytochrome P450
VSAHPPGIVLHPDLDVAVDALHVDPLPVWAWLRRNRPVARIPALGVTVVTRWCDVDRVTRDAEVFSAAVPGSPLVSTIGPNMLHAQGAEHLRMRGLLSGLMRVRRLRDEHEPALRQRAADLLAALGPCGHADIMRELALPLASLLLERLVGLPDLAQPTLGRWLRGIAAGAGNFERDPGKAREAAAVSSEIDETVAEVLSVGPNAGTLLDILSSAGCTCQEINGTVKLFVIGGLQEPCDLLGLTMLALLQNPRELARIRAGVTPVTRAVEEAARWGSPVGTVTRIATRRVEMSGSVLRAGEVVAGILASANHDEEHWANPDSFRPDRAEGPHLAFAAGAHTCVGASAARMFVRCAVEEILGHWERVRRAGPADIRGYEFRGPVAIPVEWS